MLLIVVIGLLGAAATVDRRCSPLSANDTVSFEYRKATLNFSRISYNTNVYPDASGKYPELTYIKRTCKNLPAGSKLQGLVVGMCYNAEWRFSSTPVCPQFGCKPLEKSVSVSYEYYKKLTKGMGMGSVTKPDKDGKYPEQTLVRRYCNQLPENSPAQGRTYAECLASEWKVKDLPDCRFAAGCDEKYLLRKLGFDGISKEESEVLKFPEDKKAKYHQPGSKVTATCNGQPVKLTCADGGYWVTTDSRKALCQRDGLHS